MPDPTSAPSEQPQRIINWLSETRLSCRRQESSNENYIPETENIDPPDPHDDVSSSSDVDSSDAFPFHPKLLVEAMQKAGVRFGFRDGRSMDIELDKMLARLLPTGTQPSKPT